MFTHRVLISGASIAGPALAYWLDRYGFRVTAVRKAPGLRPGGQAGDFKRRTPRADAGRGVAVMTGEFPGGPVEILRGDLAAILFERTSDGCEYRFGDSITAL